MMLGLPKTTEFNKRIPKQKFYENINVTPVSYTHLDVYKIQEQKYGKVHG